MRKLSLILSKIVLIIFCLIFFVACDKDDAVINLKPEISDLFVDIEGARVEEVINVTSVATDEDDEELSYSWYVDGEKKATNTNNPSIKITLPEKQEITISLEVSDGESVVTKELVYSISQVEFFDTFNNGKNPWKALNLDYSFINGKVQLERKDKDVSLCGLTYKVNDTESFKLTGIQTAFGHNADLKYDDYFALKIAFDTIDYKSSGKQLFLLYLYVHPGEVIGVPKNWSIKASFIDLETKEYSYRYFDINEKNKILQELVNLTGDQRKFTMDISPEGVLKAYVDDLLFVESSEIKEMIEEEEILFDPTINYFSFLSWRECNLLIDNIYLY
ncbi:hypothetical protein E9993_16005 [Labilibacter sediminis]|nr:hypothetical protein E9993_16005 [Labilibacter sediminis]